MEVKMIKPDTTWLALLRDQEVLEEGVRPHLEIPLPPPERPGVVPRVDPHEPKRGVVVIGDDDDTNHGMIIIDI
jgi:hypothetical protein